LTIATQEEEVAAVELDDLITWDGWDDPSLLYLAQQHYESYAAHIQVILKKFFYNKFVNTEHFGLLWNQNRG
jgi:hypothetical protein